MTAAIQTYSVTTPSDKQFFAAIVPWRDGVEVVSTRSGAWAEEPVLRWYDLIRPEQRFDEYEIRPVAGSSVPDMAGRKVPKPTFNPYHDEHGKFTHGDFIEAKPEDFVAARDKSSKIGFLSPSTADDLKDHLLLTNKDKTVGVAIDKQGDIGNLFNNDGPKGEAAKAMVAAIANGGRTLDCFDGYLPRYYRQFGFVETGRVKFSDEHAPKGWDYEKFQRPDVVFMKWNGYNSAANEVFARVADKKNWVKNEESKRYFDDWQRAKDESRK